MSSKVSQEPGAYSPQQAERPRLDHRFTGAENPAIWALIITIICADLYAEPGSSGDFLCVRSVRPTEAPIGRSASRLDCEEVPAAGHAFEVVFSAVVEFDA
jgi:hypothetical protein